ncbi:jg11049 [Pararge aegeria aegeria]|uniref:Jg11049 protein n=1 Tax=Pararge aegeria aegeria TaxID=348720 RepID=A0A8S4R909_9NEOP|nr:jg11049 [Pararge aegeria aegeria]
MKQYCSALGKNGSFITLLRKQFWSWSYPPWYKVWSSAIDCLGIDARQKGREKEKSNWLKYMRTWFNKITRSLFLSLVYSITDIEILYSKTWSSQE